MHADTDAIRGYGGATIDLGADLRGAVAALSTDLGPTVTDAFGPVGARFAQALADAAEALMTCMTKIGDDIATSGTATIAAARDYDDVEQRAGAQIERVAT
jgi:hypothetical protein